MTNQLVDSLPNGIIRHMKTQRDPSRDRMDPAKITIPPQRRPEWIRVQPPSGTSYKHVKELINVKVLHTVCEEAHCPNIGEMLWQRHGHLPSTG